MISNIVPYFWKKLVMERKYYGLLVVIDHDRSVRGYPNLARVIISVSEVTI